MDIPLYFYIAYNDLDRLSPGSEDTTLKAIAMIDLNSSDELNIVDIACGVGTSTITLANYFENSICTLCFNIIWPSFGTCVQLFTQMQT